MIKYNRQNEKCNFEKRKVHFLVFFRPFRARLFDRRSIIAQTLFNRLKNSYFYSKIIPQTFCGLRDFYYLCIVILAAFTPNLRPFS